jgi:hypothetical protein
MLGNFALENHLLRFRRGSANPGGKKCERCG